MVIYGSSTGIALIAPYLIEEFIAGDDSLSILCQELQSFKLLRSERNLLAEAGYIHSGKIHHYVFKSIKHLGTDPGRPPYQRAQTRHQLARAERDGYVVVGTYFQEKDFVDNVRVRAKNYEGEIRNQPRNFPAKITP